MSDKPLDTGEEGARKAGRPAGVESFEPTGEAYLRLMEALRVPDNRTAAGRPIMARVAQTAGIPKLWVQRAWADGWKKWCYEDVTHTPLSKRLLSAQMDARANIEDEASKEAAAAREKTDKAVKQATKVYEQEERLATATRENTMALVGIFQQVTQPFLAKAKELSAVVTNMDMSKMTPAEVLDILGRYQRLASGLAALTHNAYVLERQRVGDPVAVIGHSGLNGPESVGAGAGYPATPQEAAYNIIAAQRAVARLARSGKLDLVQVAPELLDMAKQDALDVVGEVPHNVLVGDDEDLDGMDYDATEGEGSSDEDGDDEDGGDGGPA